MLGIIVGLLLWMQLVLLLMLYRLGEIEKKMEEQNESRNSN